MKFDDTLDTIISINIKNNTTVFLAGESGIGKSKWVEALAKHMGTRCFTLACNNLAAKEDLTGARLIPTPDGKSYTQAFYPHIAISEAITYAQDNPRENVILFLDEINRTTADVTSGVLTMDTDRRIGNTDLPDNLRLIVAGNLRGNITTLDEASLSRFAIYNVEPDAGVFMQIMGDKLNPLIQNALTKRPDLILCRKSSGGVLVDSAGATDPDDPDSANALSLADLDEADDMAQFTTPRTLEALNDFLNALDEDTIKSFVATEVTSTDGRKQTQMEEIIEAHIGATEFAVLLFGELITSLQQANPNVNARSNAPVKPDVFEHLTQHPDRQSLENRINGMTSNEKSQSLIYALYDDRDHATVIECLVNNMTTLDLGTDALRQLMLLSASGDLNQINMNALQSTPSKITDNLSLLFSV